MKECYICKTTQNLHKHHVFGGTANRKLSEKYKMFVYLCGPDHNMSNKGIHFNKKMDFRLKQIYQQKFMSMYPDLNFVKIFGKNYLGMTWEEYKKNIAYKGVE